MLERIIMSSIDKWGDIAHPTNRVWPGTPHTIMPSIDESYTDGFIRGKQWPKDWQYIPGGPFMSRKDERFIALCEHEKKVYNAYMDGWYNGFKEQYRNKPLPQWYRP